jgi:hypothetical protein
VCQPLAIGASLGVVRHCPVLHVLNSLFSCHILRSTNLQKILYS